MVSTEVISAAALLSITLAIANLMRRHRDPAFTGIAWLFGGFSLACALTQMAEVSATWWPGYGMLPMAKAATALVSLATAVAVWSLAPRVGEAEARTRRLAEDNLKSRLEAQRLESDNKQIIDAHRLKSRFLANMSHELRTPLSSIIGFAELLHSGAVCADSPKYQEFLGHIASSGHHLLELINDILDISKVEAGKFDFSPEPLLLSALVKEVVEILHPVISQKELSISCDIDDAVDHVTLDPVRLKQVLYNYLSNATKFSHHGGHVAIRALAHGPAQFRLEVEDHGIGLAEADLPKLFDEFKQLDASMGRQEGGAGLGLALTRRIIEAQGGSVGVHSVHGRGASFHFLLNRRQGLTL